MLSTHAPKIYGHRGARGLAPENSLPGYRTALACGVDYVDMDIGMTQDGVVVVTHDIALNPNITRDSCGHWLTRNDLLVKDFTYKELQAFDVGTIKPGTQYYKLFPHQIAESPTSIPTLRQVIEYVKTASGETVGFQIEIKTDPLHPQWTATPEQFAQAIIEVLNAMGVVQRTEVQAFDYRCLLALQKLDAQVQTAYLTAADSKLQMLNPDPQVAGLWTAGYLLKNYSYSIPQMIASLGGKIWGPQDVELTRELVQAAHDFGLKVVPWSWPEKKGQEFSEEMVLKLIDLGVDGIITDRPDLLQQLFVDTF